MGGDVGVRTRAAIEATVISDGLARLLRRHFEPKQRCDFRRRETRTGAQCARRRRTSPRNCGTDWRECCNGTSDVVTSHIGRRLRKCSARIHACGILGWMVVLELYFRLQREEEDRLERCK